MPHAPSPFALSADPAARQTQILNFAIIGAALLALIFSLLPYYTVKASLLGASYTQSANAWGSWASVLGVILVVLGGAAVALIVFGILPAALHSTVRLAALGGFGLGWLLIVISLFYVPGLGGTSGSVMKAMGVSIGRGIGAWVTVLCATVALGVSVWLFLKAGPTNRPALAGLIPHGAPGAVPPGGFRVPPQAPPPGFGAPQPGFGAPPQAPPFQAPGGFGVPPQAPPPQAYPPPGQPPAAPTA